MRSLRVILKLLEVSDAGAISVEVHIRSFESSDGKGQKPQRANEANDCIKQEAVGILLD
jgi:hypothetical protein